MDKEPSMENLVSISHFRKYVEGKNVLVTGHTGFKGSWLIQILSLCRANILGYALEAETNSLYHEIHGDDLCHSVIADIRNKDLFTQKLIDFQPDYIFHLAAQPLVIDGYKEPYYTFDVNIMGTAVVLDALRQLRKKCIGVMITTDKVYENKEAGTLFSEEDKLGGYDPYSASKAGSEIVISSYRDSFFHSKNFEEHQKSIASVRAGNVIGGGDYAENRIVPDIARSLLLGQDLVLRNPKAVRPWQHVLEPLGAYLLLACKMTDDETRYNTSYNIGPEKDDILRVEELTKIALEVAGKEQVSYEQETPKVHEASLLHLDIDKIKKDCGWKPKMDARQAIQKTMEWYLSTEEASVKCLRQINAYFQNKIDDFDEN